MKTVKLREFIDRRGSLVENTQKNIMTATQHFFVSKSKPGVVRGNHYHEKKSEWFYVIQGTCRICVEDKDSKKREELILKSEDNLIVLMEPKKAHAIENIGDNELILLALINEVLDHEKPDTYSYKVI